MATTQLRVLMMLALFCSSRAGACFAERAPENKNEATHIVTGIVERVFCRDAAQQCEFIVQIKLDAVERGNDYQRGEHIYVFCSRRKRNSEVAPSAVGHSGIPKEGQRIRAIAKRKKGLMEALYPDWYETLESPITTSVPAMIGD